MARSFNGTTAKIDAGSNSRLNPSGDSTLSAWFNPSTLTFPSGNAYAAVAGRNPVAAAAGSYIIYLKSTGKMAWYWNSTSVDPGSGTASINTWSHGAIVTKGGAGGATAYLNGVLDGTGGNAPTEGTNTSNFYIGQDFANPTLYWFPGSIADVAVWNVALTVAEVQALSRGARPGTVRPNALVGWWPLDGLQSPEPDLSGGALNGTLTGTALAAGPPLMMLTPRWPMGSILPTSGPPQMIRKTLSPIGTRIGSRQVHVR